MVQWEQLGTKWGLFGVLNYNGISLKYDYEANKQQEQTQLIHRMDMRHIVNFLT